MSETSEKIGSVHETHGHVLKIIIDKAAKKNAFSPEMMAEMSEAMTYLESGPALAADCAPARTRIVGLHECIVSRDGVDCRTCC